MKKPILRSTLKFLLILVFCFISLYAFADSITHNAKTNSVLIVCDGLDAGKPYSFIATRSANVENGLTQADLIYLNQFKASSEGTIRVMLMDDGLLGVCFYVGGEMQGVQLLRYIGKYGEITSSIQTPAMLKDIEDEAFAGETFQAAYLGNVESIGSKAFLDCEELIYVQIRSRTTEIADDAFQGCRNLLFSCYEDSSAYRYAKQHSFAVEIIPSAE